MKTILTICGALLLGLGLGLGLPTQAYAQFAADSGEPISGSSDQAQTMPGKVVLSGQVDIRQGSARLLADSTTFFLGDSGRLASANEALGDFERMEAVGNFFYITPEQEVTGRQAVYERATESFTVTGDVILLQGEDNVVTGERLVYNLKTQQAVVSGNCRGRRCGNSGRVNILIKNNDNQVGG